MSDQGLDATRKKSTRAVPIAALEWIVNGETGISSETICSAFLGIKKRRADIPYDPSDFGRCRQLLEAVPEWRGRLHEVAEMYPRWRPFVEAWGELEVLYRRDLLRDDGMAPETYALMKRIRGVR